MRDAMLRHSEKLDRAFKVMRRLARAEARIDVIDQMLKLLETMQVQSAEEIRQARADLDALKKAGRAESVN